MTSTQIRIPVYLHKAIKIEAAKKGLTMAAFIDEIYRAWQRTNPKKRPAYLDFQAARKKTN